MVTLQMEAEKVRVDMINSTRNLEFCDAEYKIDAYRFVIRTLRLTCWVESR